MWTLFHPSQWKPCNNKWTNGKDKAAEVVAYLCVWCLLFKPFVGRRTATTGDVRPTLLSCTGHACVSGVLAAPNPDIFFVCLALLAGVFLSLPLCLSQQPSCPPAGRMPTSTPPPDFKHVVLGARVMALPTVCSYRKQMSQDLFKKSLLLCHFCTLDWISLSMTRQTGKWQHTVKHTYFHIYAHGCLLWIGCEVFFFLGFII